VPPTQVVLSVAILGIVCTALAFLLFFALIAEAGPIRATIITYVNPAVALVLGVLLLAEPLTVGMAIGFALIAVGSFVATRPSTGMPAARSTLSEST
jgi:drug/metabolite transporter (DMT)-like permease